MSGPEPPATSPEDAPGPYAPPRAALLAVPEAEKPTRLRALAFGVAVCLLLALLAVFMFLFIGAFQQVFASFGADLPVPTRAVAQGRAAWFALPPLALALGLMGWFRKPPAAEFRRGIIRMLVTLLVGALILASAATYCLYLPIFAMGPTV